jgi:hypothetical protein
MCTVAGRFQNSVRKTHRVIIVEECMRSGGIGASVSSWISENLLEDLDHEVIRLSSQDVPTAYAKLLEDGALALCFVTRGCFRLQRLADFLTRPVCTPFPFRSPSHDCASKGRADRHPEDLRLDLTQHTTTHLR